MSTNLRKKLLNSGSFILGFGLLGAIDGIVFHQLLQWHSVYMHTHRQGQIVSDGLFHAFTVVALVIGAILLWRAGTPIAIDNGKRQLLGGILLGGGVFNFSEGLINHQILQVHHVKMGDPNWLAYDMAFLASGLILFIIGWMIRKDGANKNDTAQNV